MKGLKNWIETEVNKTEIEGNKMFEGYDKVAVEKLRKFNIPLEVASNVSTQILNK